MQNEIARVRQVQQYLSNQKSKVFRTDAVLETSIERILGCIPDAQQKGTAAHELAVFSNTLIQQLINGLETVIDEIKKESDRG